MISLIFHFFNQKSSILLYQLNNKTYRSGNWIIIFTKKLTLNPTCYGMCNPENINTSPTEGNFSKTPPPLWKFQSSFIHFFIFFGLTEPPTPQEIPIPSVGGVWIFSRTAQWKSSLELTLVEWHTIQLKCTILSSVIINFQPSSNHLPFSIHFQSRTPAIWNCFHLPSEFKIRAFNCITHSLLRSIWICLAGFLKANILFTSRLTLHFWTVFHKKYIKRNVIIYVAQLSSHN